MTYLDIIKNKRWILTAYGRDGNIGSLLTNNFGDFIPSRQNTAVRDFVSIFRKNGKMIISWSIGSSPSGRITDYDFAVEISLNKNCNLSAGANNPGIGGGSDRFSSSNPYIQNTKVRVNVIKGDPNLPEYMYVRNSTFGAQYGNVYGLISNEGWRNSQLDWGPDGQPYKSLYIGYKGIGYYSNNRGQRFVPRSIAVWYCYDN